MHASQLPALLQRSANSWQLSVFELYWYLWMGCGLMVPLHTCKSCSSSALLLKRCCREVPALVHTCHACHLPQTWPVTMPRFSHEHALIMPRAMAH